MGTISTSRRIDASTQTVFDALTDFANLADNIPAITRVEMLTDGPVGIGTRFRETRVVMKKEATEEMEVTAFDPGHTYAVECESCGAHYRTDVTVRADGAGSVAEMSMQARPISFAAKLMTPLAPLMNRMLMKCIEKDLDQIKTNLESPSNATSTA